MGGALVIRYQFLIEFAPVAVSLIKLDMISYGFHKSGRYLRSRDFWWVLVDCCYKITCFGSVFVNTVVASRVVHGKGDGRL